MAGANAAYRGFRDSKPLRDRKQRHPRFSQLMNFSNVLIRALPAAIHRGVSDLPVLF